MTIGMQGHMQDFMHLNVKMAGVQKSPSFDKGFQILDENFHLIEDKDVLEDNVKMAIEKWSKVNFNVTSFEFEFSRHFYTNGASIRFHLHKSTSPISAIVQVSSVENRDYPDPEIQRFMKIMHFRNPGIEASGIGIEIRG